MKIVYVRITDIAKIRDVAAYHVAADVHAADWPTPVDAETLGRQIDAVTITQTKARDGYQCVVGIAPGRIYASVSVDQVETIAEKFVAQFLQGDFDDEIA